MVKAVELTHVWVAEHHKQPRIAAEPQAVQLVKLEQAAGQELMLKLLPEVQESNAEFQEQPAVAQSPQDMRSEHLLHKAPLLTTMDEEGHTSEEAEPHAWPVWQKLHEPDTQTEHWSSSSIWATSRRSAQVVLGQSIPLAG